MNIIRGRDLSIERVSEIAYLEKAVFPDDIAIPEHVLQMWYSKNPDVFWCIEDKERHRVIGHICAIPLNEQTFQKTSDADFDDRELRTENIVKYDNPGLYKLYLCTIAVDPKYQNVTITYKKILNAYYQMLFELTKKDIYMSEVSSMAVSREGCRISEFLGMKMKSRGLHDSKLYHQYMFPPDFKRINSQSIELQQIYMKKYEECKLLI